MQVLLGAPVHDILIMTLIFFDGFEEYRSPNLGEDLTSLDQALANARILASTGMTVVIYQSKDKRRFVLRTLKDGDMGIGWIEVKRV